MSHSALLNQMIAGNEASLQVILNSLPQGLLICDSAGLIFFANTRCKELFQLPDISALHNTSFLDLLDAQERCAIIDKLHHISEWTSFSSTCTFRRYDGTSFLAEINLSVNNHLSALQIVISISNLLEQREADIRLRKEMEFALQETDARYSLVVRNAPIVLFEIDKMGIFRLSEGGALKKIGLTPGQVVGFSAFEIYKDFPDIIDHIQRALEGEIIHDKTNVNGIIFDIYYHPVFSSRRKIISVIGIAVEITDKDKAEQSLIESEEKFRTLFESMSEGVALHDLVFNDSGEPVNYRINDVNPSYAKHTGLSLTGIKGKLGTEVYGTELPPYFKEFSNVAITGKPFNFETYFPPLDRYFKISVVRTGMNRFATVFEDITAAKNRERELKSKNEELERFTYTVSHDLRSPLVTIKGFIGMLQQDIASGNIEGISDDIRRINMAADKMSDLLNDLLELSQIGRIINPPVRISMKQIVDETIELLNGIIAERSVEIRVINELPMVFVDKRRLAEVWQNLIENAIKFTSNQQNPLIEIGSIADYGENVFYIKDNGQGIDPKYHETIFGLFNKLDLKSQGTGIGLSLVHRIIDIHGGKIWVESEGEGKGSTIKFTIPNKV